MKLTGWYEGKQKPVRPGVYQRKDRFGYIFSYWDNRYWRVGFDTKKEAQFWGSDPCISLDQNSWPWSGTAK